MPVWIVECVRFGVAALFFAAAGWTVWSGYRGAPDASDLVWYTGVVQSARETTDNDVTMLKVRLQGETRRFEFDDDQPAYASARRLQPGDRVELGIDGRRFLFPRPADVYELRQDGQVLISYTTTAQWADDPVGMGWCVGTMWALFGLLALKISGIRSGSRLERLGGYS